MRTASGSKLMGIDALSNEKPTDAELAKFKLPLEPEEVRKKLRALERAFQQVRHPRRHPRRHTRRHTRRHPH